MFLESLGLSEKSGHRQHTNIAPAAKRLRVHVRTSEANSGDLDIIMQSTAIFRTQGPKS